jgi:hypothetical protein
MAGFRRAGMGTGVESSDAVISTDGRYRYKLNRYWTRRKPPAVWIMLNPSTANAVENDPTIRRCVSFAKHWGFGGIEVYNLFALRSSHPVSIETAADPVGPDNDKWLKEIVHSEGTIVLAWGHCRTPLQSRRAARVLEFLLLGQNVFPKSLGLTKGGHPRHPLYVRGNARLCSFPFPPNFGDPGECPSPLKD